MDKLTPEHERWNKDMGDSTHRLNYDLNEDSIVIDLGGYKGNWSTEITIKYLPYIYVFEPIEELYDICVGKFHLNWKIKVIKAAAHYKNEDIDFYIQGNDGDGTSYLPKDFFDVKTAKGIDFVEFIKNENIENVDLMKLNIEGAEYKLLNHIIDSGIIHKFKNIQVQFHDMGGIGEDGSRKKEYEKLAKKLSKTHHLTYQYIGIWENWEING